MKIYKIADAAVIVHKQNNYRIPISNWDTFINRENLYELVLSELPKSSNFSGKLNFDLVAKPMGTQEIWASGVTYLRSKAARMEESKKSGGDTFYDKVYDADRPELFFKSTPHRTVCYGKHVKIRKDSNWNVPEPELTLFVCSTGSIQGYTIGNDMSSRSIEGENPLYLPQAKTYDGCAALGPCLYVPKESIDLNSEIKLEIFRAEKSIFKGAISISQMKRNFEDLVSYLFRECSFPNGVFLMTGTGIVPPDDFSLKPHDEIRITINPIGQLINYVAL